MFVLHFAVLYTRFAVSILIFCIGDWVQVERRDKNTRFLEILVIGTVNHRQNDAIQDAISEESSSYFMTYLRQIWHSVDKLV